MRTNYPESWAILKAKRARHPREDAIEEFTDWTLLGNPIEVGDGPKPAAADVFELQCVFLPHPKAPAFGAAAEGLKGTVVEAAGRWCSMVTPWAQHQRRRRRPFAAPPAPLSSPGRA